jgi:hypothetical protein
MNGHGRQRRRIAKKQKNIFKRQEPKRLDFVLCSVGIEETGNNESVSRAVSFPEIHSRSAAHGDVRRTIACGRSQKIQRSSADPRCGCI